MPAFPHRSCLALFLLPLYAFGATPDEYAERRNAEAMQEVIVYLDHKDCKGAVKALNKGLASRQPGVILMAASMFEQGICVKAEWDTAARYYQMAHHAGQREALPRLISGYAEKNRDPGAALWWLANNTSLPAPCRSASHLANDPDAFVAALNKWPKGQVEACVYTGGVMMRVMGDIEFPGRAAGTGVFGDAIMHFVPASGAITWTSAGTERIAVSREVIQGKNDQTEFNDVFLKHVRAIGERALAQFSKPEGIDPAWKVETRFSFKYQ